MDQDWISQAITRIEADFRRSSDTHLLKIELPAIERVNLYLKDESTHPTGSLKHRLARSLFLYGLCNGLIREGTTIIESSSGSTAISEAYFAKLLGLPFVAVIPKTTSQEKIDKIEFYHGRCHLVEAKDIYSESERLAAELNGHYMDQFTFAERATDWRGNNNIAESIFAQMSAEPNPVPAWIVVSAGTGGTSAVFFDYFNRGDRGLVAERGSMIEGIGRPRVEPSFIASIVDRMIKVPDAASYATIHFMETLLNRRCGGSTGTNLYAAFQIMTELDAQGAEASLVSMICDGGERYLDTYYNPDWLAAKGFDTAPYRDRLAKFYETGVLDSS